jgi:alanine-synthesizing transaminase
LTDATSESFTSNQDCLTFTLSGLSKIAALPQMKVAWVAATGPEELRNAALERLEIIADTYLSLNSPTQWAFAELLEQRRSLQPQVRERVQQNWAHLREALKNGAWELLDAEGGWYAVLRIPGERSDEDFAVELLQKTNTVVHPGHFYDFHRDGYVVISLITPVEDFRSGVSCLVAFLKSRGR